MDNRAPTPPLFLNSAQVAETIGYGTAAAFMANRDRLETETLFPLPMPITRYRALRWRRDEVLAWIERHGQPRPPVGSANLHLLRLAASA